MPPASQSQDSLSLGLMGMRVAVRVMKRVHVHTELELNYVVRGSLDYLHSGRVVRVPAGRMVAFWGAVPHRIIATRKTGHLSWITIPLAWVLQWNLPQSFVDGFLDGCFFSDNKGEPFAAERFDCWIEDIRGSVRARQMASLLEIEAAIRRMAVLQGEGSPSGTHPMIVSKPLSRLQQIARYIATHYTEKVRIEHIAREIGLNPQYITSLFVKSTGVHITDYLNEHRLFHGMRLLATTDFKIPEIARQSGFGTVSSFYAGFTRFCKQSPDQYRKRHRL